MCTLTFLPANSGFVLTSNRDESFQRPHALPPKQRQVNGRKIYFPKDPLGGGSWIAVDKTGRSACILNGAFGKHEPNPPYRKSRGLILLDAMMAPDIPGFLENHGLENVEPFTLVVISEMPLLIFQLQWDGNERHIQTMDADKAQIWSAPLLYPPEVRKASEARFIEFLNTHRSPQPDDLLLFNESERYEQKMSAHQMESVPELKTLSTSQVILNAEGVRFIYHDLEEDRIYEVVV